MLQVSAFRHWQFCRHGGVSQRVALASCLLESVRCGRLVPWSVPVWAHRLTIQSSTPPAAAGRCYATPLISGVGVNMMRNFIVRFAVVGVAIPLGTFLLSSVVPLFPNALLNVLLVFCPGYILFMSTAACAPLSACTLQVLAFVVFTNAVLYCLIGSAAWHVLLMWCKHSAQ